MTLLLFSGDVYYPSGGAWDLVGSVETPEAATGLLSGTSDWAHVLDVDTGTIVAEWRRVETGTRMGAPGWTTVEDYRRRLDALTRPLP